MNTLWMGPLRRAWASSLWTLMPQVLAALLVLLVLPPPAAAQNQSTDARKSIPTDSAASDNPTATPKTPAENAKKSDATPAAPDPNKGAGTGTAKGATTTDKGTTSNDNPYASVASLLFKLFALAVVLESALSVLFNWRPFIENFDARGWKTVISVASALILVNAFDGLDLVSALIGVVDNRAIPSPIIGTLLTALVIAGGSAGVNSLLVALGFRSMRTAETIAPRPVRTQAWVAVRLATRAGAPTLALGPVHVCMSVDGGVDSVIGIITGRSHQNRLLRYFFPDRGRLPTAGGLAVDGGKSYRFCLLDPAGQPVPGVQWGPHPIAAGAIVDISFDVGS